MSTKKPQSSRPARPSDYDRASAYSVNTKPLDQAKFEESQKKILERYGAMFEKLAKL